MHLFPKLRSAFNRLPRVQVFERQLLESSSADICVFRSMRVSGIVNSTSLPTPLQIVQARAELEANILDAEVLWGSAITAPAEAL